MTDGETDWGNFLTILCAKVWPCHHGSYVHQGMKNISLPATKQKQCMNLLQEHSSENIGNLEEVWS